MKPLSTSALKAERIEVVPLASSSAPGAGRNGSRLVESVDKAYVSSVTMCLCVCAREIAPDRPPPRTGCPESLELDGFRRDCTSTLLSRVNGVLTLVRAEDNDPVGRVTAEVVTRRLGLEPRND